MIISRKIYDDMHTARVKAEAVRDSLLLQNAALNAHMNWMQIRLTEMSMERAQMLKRYLNIDVAVPSFEQPDTHPDPNQTMDFNDVGDAMAQKLGMSWANDGTILYADK